MWQEIHQNSDDTKTRSPSDITMQVTWVKRIERKKPSAGWGHLDRLLERGLQLSRTEYIESE